jgi:hypothetical protein
MVLMIKMEFGNRWQKEIYTMARKSYLAVKLGKPSELYTIWFILKISLVDAKEGVRGFMTVLIKRISKN